MSLEIQVRNDTDVVLRGFRDRRAASGVYLNAATGTWEIRTAKSPGGTQVATGDLEYVTGSNGEYVGGIDDAVSLTEGITYWLHVVIAEGGVQADVERPFTATRRLGTSPVS